ncbi:RagB/SusD family nutrient uptake outer membrane protein [Pseudopedobacter beijingensis]|uniref:RagB/SusD family nutrient uptake outer membrane protein n=1 Tax=Pseudopedobacter beijingensis TaxID=1207056 RepID=A0ABW4IAA3_9SPHI
MKNHLKYIISKSGFRRLVAFGLFAITTQGCSSFLDKEPTFIVKENYFNNENDVNMALTGIYDVMGREQFYGSSLPVYLSIADDGAYYRTAYTSGPAVYVFNASEPLVEQLWQYLYQGIERANVFLSRVDEVSMSETDKNDAIGQAKFLRAYYYFLLVSNWGDVPLKTVPTPSVNTVDVPATPQKDVYNFVVKEMEEAEGMVKPITAYGHAGRVSKSAVRGILARVYLKMAGAPLKDVSKYADALKWAEKLVHPSNGDYQHALVSDYSKVFKDMAGDKYNIKESIWEVEFYGNNFTDFEAGRVGNLQGIQCNDESKGFSYGFVVATKKLYESYENSDERRDWNIATYKYVHVNNVVTDSTFYPNTDIENRMAAKFRRGYETYRPRNKNYTPINFPVLRYSDVLLMYAEAENEVNGATLNAKNALKEVRDRVHASDISATLVTPDDLKKAIKEERFRELCFEGLRKYDLIRWGEFVDTMNKLGSDIRTSGMANIKYTALAGEKVTTRNNLLPIPLSEISLNGGVHQNEGW